MIASDLLLAAAASCLQATAAIPAGAVPVRADFAAVACDGAGDPALRWDSRIRALRAARDVAPGETIAAPLSLLPDVAPGETLFLVTRVGTATVEREVVAAQPGRHGERVFVRTSDGRLISARLPEDAR